MVVDISNSPNLKQRFSTLIDLLQQRSQDQADQTAFIFLADGVCEAGRLTYRELETQAKAIAVKLQTVLQPGDRALLLYPAGLEFISALFGCFYAGVIAVPVAPPSAKQALLHLPRLIEDTGARIGLTVASEVAALKQYGRTHSELKRLKWFVTDHPPDRTADQASYWQAPAITADTLALLQYTAGITGRPKGVKITHRNILANLEMIQQAFQVSSSDRAVSWLPLYRNIGLIGGVLQPLHAGIPMVLLPTTEFLQKPILWLEAISRYRATLSGGPNFAYDLCVRKIWVGQRSQLDLSFWQVAFSGAEPVRADTLEKFVEAFTVANFRPQALYPCYGLTEATLFVSGGLKAAPPIIHSVDAAALTQNRAIGTPHPNGQRLVGCGQAWLNQRVLLVNPGTQKLCLPGQVGEIWLAGANVASGYWNQPDATEATFQARLRDSQEGPFLRTGDLGYIRAGELFVTGRLTDLITIDGRSYYPQAIETTAEQSHASILKPNCCAAFTVTVAGQVCLGIVAEIERRYWNRRSPNEAKSRLSRRRQPDRRRSSQLDAEPDLRQPFDPEEAIAAIRLAVSDQYQLPVYTVLLLKPGSVPKTPNGKVERYLCRELFLERKFKPIVASTLQLS